MKISIGNDHAAVELKEHIKAYLIQKGYEVIDNGVAAGEKGDYPVMAEKTCRRVLSGECERGIVICGSGVGISIASNKLDGIRCALCSESYSAAMCRRHNDANVLAMGARVIGPELAETIVDAFLTGEFEGGRHQRRIDMFVELEQNQTIQR